ncbi:hypothetical protein KM043_010185 [Ampulex compressa]|nr:hypothetical protein KM043_010185 [Ampulex compressa]
MENAQCADPEADKVVEACNKNRKQLEMSRGLRIELGWKPADIFPRIATDTEAHCAWHRATRPIPTSSTGTLWHFGLVTPYRAAKTHSPRAVELKSPCKEDSGIALGKNSVKDPASDKAFRVGGPWKEGLGILEAQYGTVEDPREEERKLEDP